MITAPSARGKGRSRASLAARCWASLPRLPPNLRKPLALPGDPQRCCLILKLLLGFVLKLGGLRKRQMDPSRYKNAMLSLKDCSGLW